MAHANAWHDAVVFDDRAFFGPDRRVVLESLPEAFERELWGGGGYGYGLYRPLLLIQFELENRVFGDWLRGYHAVNVLLNLVVTLLLYGFLAALMRRSGIGDRATTIAAVLAALAFAVHPAHAEVVNSAFNRSSMFVALFAISGLWWLFHYLDRRPAIAWTGFGLLYTVSIFFKESALVIPGLAVAFIVILGPGNIVERFRRFLPVFLLFIPIALYFYLRAQALATMGAADDVVESEFGQLLAATHLPDPGRFLSVLGVLGEGLKVLIWPWPLQLYYYLPVGAELVVLIAAFAALAVMAVILWSRGRPATAAGLAFYFVAMLPATRLLSMDGAGPHLADRYLYFPSVGIALILAFLLAAALQRWPRRAVLACVFPLILLLTAAGWARNSDWSSQSVLFESDYARGIRTQANVRILISEHADEQRWSRISEICDENPKVMENLGEVAIVCGTAYLNTQRNEDGFAALNAATEKEETWLRARLLLIEIRIAEGRKREASEIYREIIERAEKTETKATHTGIMLAKLFPEDPARLREARGYFEMALELDPDHEAARRWLGYVEKQLAELAAEEDAVDILN
jgi:hypothetical protein